MLKIRFLPGSGLVKNKITHYSDLEYSQVLDIYLPSHRSYTIVDETEPADICILSTQHTNNTLLRANELNIFLTVENFSVERTHYEHFNSFGREGNPLVKLYIYNDIACINIYIYC